MALEASGSEEKPKEDVYTWMLGHATARSNLRTPEKLADFQLLLSMAAIHTTTVSVVTILYELAARPEYIEPLREEMIKAIEEDGGLLKKSTLAKMTKLDSFMKESARTNCGFRSYPLPMITRRKKADAFYPQFRSCAGPSCRLHYPTARTSQPVP